MAAVLRGQVLPRELPKVSSVSGFRFDGRRYQRTLGMVKAEVALGSESLATTDRPQGGDQCQSKSYVSAHWSISRLEGFRSSGQLLLSLCVSRVRMSRFVSKRMDMTCQG